LTLLGFGRSEAVAETKVPPPVSAGGNDRPAQPAQADSAKGGVRRDPKGQKGIGPFWEALHRGDDHALARDYPKAKEAYQAALALTPKQAIAHYRIGQIEVLSGNLPEAETAYTDALRFVDNAPELHAHLLFVLADLKERMGQRDAAIKAWQAYLDYLKSEAKAKGYRATADDRLKRILRYNELLVECKGVKERVQLRVKELEENAKRKAK
jgi:tetratricopeptide (TPR) repeat protein